MKIGRYIVAVVLLATPATQPSFAEKATSEARPMAGRIAGAKEWRSPGGAHGLKGRSSGAKGGGVRAPARQAAPAAKDLNAIGPRDGENARNAIGQPILHQQAIGGQSGGHVGPPALVPVPVQSPAATLGAAENKPASLANAGAGGPGNLRPNPGPMVTATAASRGRIDGAGLIRPGIAPSGLGGPAKAVARINGTTFRPKH